MKKYAYGILLTVILIACASTPKNSDAFTHENDVTIQKETDVIKTILLDSTAPTPRPKKNFMSTFKNIEDMDAKNEKEILAQNYLREFFSKANRLIRSEANTIPSSYWQMFAINFYAICYDNSSKERLAIEAAKKTNPIIEGVHTYIIEISKKIDQKTDYWQKELKRRSAEISHNE